MNTDPSRQFTSTEWIDRVSAYGSSISRDGKGCWWGQHRRGAALVVAEA